MGRRAAALLDRKLRILHGEQERFTMQQRLAEQEWLSAQALADSWLDRAFLTGGDRELRLAAPTLLAQVELDWAEVMGLRYPSAGSVHPPPPEPAERGPGSAAVLLARRAHERALAAAVQAAVASAALALVRREADVTRQRMHAINDRWVPRLEQALHVRVEQLEEDERAETVRLRWGAWRAASGGGS
jgi:V/A-type H+/Na+-transporting ATPase subunit D